MREGKEESERGGEVELEGRERERGYSVGVNNKAFDDG